jgi:hypothetical protein
VRVVHAWQFRSPYGRSAAVEGVPLVLGANLDGYSRAASAELDAIVAEAALGAGGFGIEKRVEQGDPATVLIDQSRVRTCSSSARAATAASPVCSSAP